MLQTKRAIAQPVSPIQNIQATAGNITKDGPICAIHSISINADSNEAKGTPAIAKPIPPRAVCTIAVTPTPNATPTDDISVTEPTTVNGKVFDDTNAPLDGVTIRAKSLNRDYDPFDITAKMDFAVFGKILTVWKSEQV